jgi:hypothetical protein
MAGSPCGRLASQDAEIGYGIGFSGKQPVRYAREAWESAAPQRPAEARNRVSSPEFAGKHKILNAGSAKFARRGERATRGLGSGFSHAARGAPRP